MLKKHLDRFASVINRMEKRRRKQKEAKKQKEIKRILKKLKHGRTKRAGKKSGRKK